MQLKLHFTPTAARATARATILGSGLLRMVLYHISLDTVFDMIWLNIAGLMFYNVGKFLSD